MSRLCRLKTKTHGEDGQWAYEEITKLREQVAAQAHELKTLRLQCISDFGQYVDGTQELKETIAAQAAVIEKLREAVQEYLAANDPSEFGCACDLDTGYLCGPCHAAKQQYPLQKTLAIPTDSTQVLAEVRKQERERVAEFILRTNLGGIPKNWQGFAADGLFKYAEAIRAME